MDKKSFSLRVKIGTQIIFSGGDFVVEDIPDTAWELIKQGSVWLSLNESFLENFSNISEKELQETLTIREKQGFSDDALILEKALKTLKKNSKGSPKV